MDAFKKNTNQQEALELNKRYRSKIQHTVQDTTHIDTRA